MSLEFTRIQSYLSKNANTGQSASEFNEHLMSLYRYCTHTIITQKAYTYDDLNSSEETNFEFLAQKLYKLNIITTETSAAALTKATDNNKAILISRIFPETTQYQPNEFYVDVQYYMINSTQKIDFAHLNLFFYRALYAYFSIQLAGRNHTTQFLIQSFERTQINTNLILSYVAPLFRNLTSDKINDVKNYVRTTYFIAELHPPPHKTINYKYYFNRAYVYAKGITVRTESNDLISLACKYIHFVLGEDKIERQNISFYEIFNTICLIWYTNKFTLHQNQIVKGRSEEFKNFYEGMTEFFSQHSGSRDGLLDILEEIPTPHGDELSYYIAPRNPNNDQPIDPDVPAESSDEQMKKMILYMGMGAVGLYMLSNFK